MLVFAGQTVFGVTYLKRCQRNHYRITLVCLSVSLFFLKIGKKNRNVVHVGTEVLEELCDLIRAYSVNKQFLILGFNYGGFMHLCDLSNERPPE